MFALPSDPENSMDNEEGSESEPDLRGASWAVAQDLHKKTVKKYYLRKHNFFHAGASTPYKRWSKCTMKKIGGKVFAGT